MLYASGRLLVALAAISFAVAPLADAYAKGGGGGGGSRGGGGSSGGFKAPSAPSRPSGGSGGFTAPSKPSPPPAPAYHAAPPPAAPTSPPVVAKPMPAPVVTPPTAAGRAVPGHDTGAADAKRKADSQSAFDAAHPPTPAAKPPSAPPSATTAGSGSPWGNQGTRPQQPASTATTAGATPPAHPPAAAPTTTVHNTTIYQHGGYYPYSPSNDWFFWYIMLQPHERTVYVDRERGNMNQSQIDDLNRRVAAQEAKEKGRSDAEIAELRRQLAAQQNQQGAPAPTQTSATGPMAQQTDQSRPSPPTVPARVNPPQVQQKEANHGMSWFSVILISLGLGVLGYMLFFHRFKSL